MKKPNIQPVTKIPLAATTINGCNTLQTAKWAVAIQKIRHNYLIQICDWCQFQMGENPASTSAQ